MALENRLPSQPAFACCTYDSLSASRGRHGLYCPPSTGPNRHPSLTVKYSKGCMFTRSTVASSS